MEMEQPRYCDPGSARRTQPEHPNREYGANARPDNVDPLIPPNIRNHSRAKTAGGVGACA